MVKGLSLLLKFCFSVWSFQVLLCWYILFRMIVFLLWFWVLVWKLVISGVWMFNKLSLLMVFLLLIIMVIVILLMFVGIWFSVILMLVCCELVMSLIVFLGEDKLL